MSQELVDRINGVRFTPVRLREGYDMGEVDLLLDEIADAVSQGRPVRPLVDAARFTPVRLREGYDMGDVDDFLEEIVRLSSAAAPPAVSTDTASGPSFPVPAASVIEERPGLMSRLFGRK